MENGSLHAERARLRVLSRAIRSFAEATTDRERLLGAVAGTLGEALGSACVVQLLARVGSPPLAEAGTLVLALSVRGEALGSISVSPRGAPFSEDDRVFAQALADHAALAIANAQLLEDARRARAAREELEAARSQAVAHARHDDRLSTVGKLAAGVAHELGTPLSVVEGHAQRIADGELVGAAAMESARSIDAEVGRVARIVRQLLDFARRTGREGNATELHAVATRVTEMLAPSAQTSGVLLHVGGSTCGARIDDASAVQILTNLVVNAIQASPRGAEVHVAVEPIVTNAPNDERERPYARLEVRDRGSGITPEVLPHVFEPFFSTKESGEGTGLGLSVVDGIVHDHGGWIALDSIPAEGTTVVVYLPLAPSASAGDLGQSDTPSRGRDEINS